MTLRRRTFLQLAGAENIMMKIPRRNFLHFAAGAAALPVVSRFALAQTYPDRPVRVVVGFTPGGPTDSASVRRLVDFVALRLAGESRGAEVERYSNPSLVG